MNNARNSNCVDWRFVLAPFMRCLIPPFDIRLVCIAPCHFLDRVIGTLVHHIPGGTILVAQGVLQGDVACRICTLVKGDMIVLVVLVELPESRTDWTVKS